LVFWLQAYEERWVFCLSHHLSVANLDSFNNNDEGAKPALLTHVVRGRAPLRNSGGFGGKVIAVTMENLLTLLLLTASLIPSSVVPDATSVAGTKASLQKRLKNQSDSGGDKMEFRLQLLGAPDACRQKKCNYVRFSTASLTGLHSLPSLQPFLAQAL